MTKRCLDLLDKARNNPKGLRFTELQKLCECAGMSLSRTKGSHFIYKHESPSYALSIQEDDGNAVAYQVRQLLNFIEEHKLDEPNEGGSNV